MSATLDLADQIVIVSGLSVDEARLASETLTWLETNGYAEQARDAIVVLNQSTPGTPLVRLNELQAHFATRARSVVRVPYDPQIAGGGTDDRVREPAPGDPDRRPRAGGTAGRGPAGEGCLMAVREIRIFGDPVSAQRLRTDRRDRRRCAGARGRPRRHRRTPGRAGVAAPQIGVALRAFSYNIDGDIGYVLNPVLTEVRGEPQPTGEGCLSVPGLWHDAQRYPWARVDGHRPRR